MAVPTTTKSLAAKIGNGDSASRKAVKREVKTPVKPNKAPKIISRIIRKPSTPAKPKVWDEEEDIDLDLEDAIDLGGAEIDLDNYSEEDLD